MREAKSNSMPSKTSVFIISTRSGFDVSKKIEVILKRRFCPHLNSSCNITFYELNSLNSIDMPKKKNIRFFIAMYDDLPMISKKIQKIPTLSSLTNEGFYVKCSKSLNANDVVIIARNSLGILHGLGKFLMSYEFDEDGLIKDLEFVDSPAFELRGMFFATHKQNNVTEFWDIEHWKEYLEDMILLGLNTIGVYPIHFARWPGVIPWGEKKWFVSEQRRREWEYRWKIHLELPNIAKEYGLRYGIWVPPNDIFPAQLQENWSLGDPYVCPSIPQARETILYDREELFKSLSNVDFIFIPSGDEGGCKKCDKIGPCHPWVKTYLELVEDTYRILQKYHPKAKIWISNQALDYEQQRILFEYLNTKAPDWLEALVYGPGGDILRTYLNPERENTKLEYMQFGEMNRYLKELFRLLPAKYKIILYPDITHPYRAQYEINKLDRRIALICGREDAPIFMGIDMKDIHDRTAVYAEGSIPYTEGNHDDFNKAVWLRLNWDPYKDINSIAKEYCKLFFGSDMLNDITKAMNIVEKVWHRRLENSKYDIDELNMIIEKVDSSLGNRVKNNWRWYMIKFISLLFKYMQTKIHDDKKYRPEFEELILKSLNHEKLLLKTINNIIAVHSKRTEEYNDIKKQLLDIAKRIEEIHRMKLYASVERLDMNMTILDWMTQELKKAMVSRDKINLRDEIEKILRYEDPGPGGYYDDLGNFDKQPHLLEDSRVLFAVNLKNINPEVRLSQNTHAWAEKGLPIVLIYNDVDSKVEYTIKVTYLADEWSIGTLQKLYANGHLIHDELELPSFNPEQYVFSIPKDVYANGSLRLEFISTNGRASVSEVWLMRKHALK